MPPTGPRWALGACTSTGGQWFQAKHQVLTREGGAHWWRRGQIALIGVTENRVEPQGRSEPIDGSRTARPGRLPSQSATEHAAQNANAEQPGLLDVDGRRTALLVSGIGSAIIVRPISDEMTERSLRSS